MFLSAEQEPCGVLACDHFTEEDSPLNHPQIVSLLEMLHVFAEDFVEMGILFQRLEDHISVHHNPNQIINEASRIWLREQLDMLTEECEKLKLKDSRILIAETVAEFKATPPTLKKVSTEIVFLKRSIKAGLWARHFFMILPHRFEYMFPKDLLTKITFEKFPHVMYDIKEAGWCFATERFTAAVYHLMRVAEYGLVSFAGFCKIEEKHRLNWNKALNDIEKCFRDKTNPNYKAGLNKSEEQYYIESLGWLRDVKTAWRNPVSHIPRVYDEEKARGLFQTVRNLMDHLSIRFEEVPLPPENDAD